MHEASLYEENSFLTLTYDDENLPEGFTLVKRDFQLFMKRLRKNYEPKKLRFFMCGEYGDDTGRPHYHINLFGHDFEDKEFYKRSKSGEPLFVSRDLERIWGKGHCPIGSLTFESAAYTARYNLKKVTGKEADKHYAGRLPEFALMSRRPGIGEPWLQKWHTDVYPHDFVVVNGKKCKPPKYYDTLMCDDFIEEIKDIRKARAEEHADNNSDERLAVREKIQTLKQERILRREI